MVTKMSFKKDDIYLLTWKIIVKMLNENSGEKKQVFIDPTFVNMHVWKNIHLLTVMHAGMMGAHFLLLAYLYFMTFLQCSCNIFDEKIIKETTLSRNNCLVSPS